MSDSISIQIDDARLRESMRTAPDKIKHGLSDWVKSTALKAERAAKHEVPVKQGILQSSIHTLISEYSATVRPTTDYAKYVIQGTGLYGPHHTLIRRANGGVFATKINPGWGKPNKAGYYILGRTLKGQHPNPFMNRAYDIVKNPAQEDANKMLDEVLAAI